jgi:protein-tyrosine kinase
MSNLWPARARAEDLTLATGNGHRAAAVHREELLVESSRALGAELTSVDSIDPHLVTLCTPTAFETEPYRLMGYMMEQIRHNRGPSIVAISSPTPGDGKTMTAINLAGVLSQTPETRVLLVDADLRRPSVSAYLGLDFFSGRGLVEAIRDPSLSIENMITRLPQFNLDVLPTGSSLASPYEVLALPRLGALLEKARQGYDYVIVDAPPLAHFADCQYIGKWVDGFLVIVAAHETPRKLFEDALDVIDPDKVIGLVFNKDERQTSSYYQYRKYYLSPSKNKRTRRRSAPLQQVANAKKNRKGRSRTRVVWLGAVVVLLLVLGVASWRAGSISVAIQGIIQGMQSTWQKVQEGFLSSDRQPPTARELEQALCLARHSDLPDCNPISTHKVAEGGLSAICSSIHCVASKAR